MNFQEDITTRAKLHDTAGNDKALWLRPTLSHKAKQDTYGWICGNPVVSTLQEWPHINDKPYDFLCQINCSLIPKKIWKGLAPRKGWLSIFFHPTSETHPFHTKIIYSSKWGEEIKPPNSYVPPSLRHLSEKFPEYKFTNTPWELEAFTPKFENGEAVRASYMQREPFHDDDFLLSNPRNQPTDWDEMELLLNDAHNIFEKNFGSWTQYKEELEAIEKPSDHERRNLEFFSNWVAHAPIYMENLRSQLHNIRITKQTSQFDTQLWSQFYSWFDEIMTPRFGSWHWGYQSVRKERTKYKLSTNPHLVPSAVKDYFNAIWTYEFERTVFQIGGGPAGFSSSFFDNALTNMFLLNASTSKVHGLDFHGSSLNVSMPITGFTMKKFGKVNSDISN